jgi:hypothetical protein
MENKYNTIQHNKYSCLAETVTATGYRMDCLGFRTPMGERDFLFFTPVYPGPPLNLLYYGYHGYFLGGKSARPWG